MCQVEFTDLICRGMRECEKQSYCLEIQFDCNTDCCLVEICCNLFCDVAFVYRRIAFCF